jgi:hypothetical protein
MKAVYESNRVLLYAVYTVVVLRLSSDYNSHRRHLRVFGGDAISSDW